MARPTRPPGRVVDRPLGDVEVERAHSEQGPGRGRPRYRRPGTVCSGRCPSRFAGDPLFPARRHHRGKAEGADPGIMAFKVTPEQSGQGVRHGPQGRVVHCELLLLEVIDEQVADRAACDAVLADQLGGGELAPGGEHAHAGRRLRREHADRAEHLVEVHSLAPGPLITLTDRGQLQAVAGGDVAGSASFGGHDGSDPPQRQVTDELADLLGLAYLPQPGKTSRVAGPGHLGGQQLQPGAFQQPAGIRPDHVTADQQQHPAGWPVSAVRKARHQVPPPGGSLRARRRPAFLPGAPG